MNRVLISHGALTGKLLRHVAWVPLVLLGPLTLLVGIAGVSSTLTGSAVGPTIGRSVLWVFVGLGFAYLGALMFRLRHSFDTAYVFSSEGVEVTPDGEMTRVVRWPAFSRAVVRPLTYTIELSAPDLERPVAIFNSAFQRGRYLILRAMIERNLGPRVQIRYI